MSDCEYESIEPFGIDGEELDGLSPQQCFVLGYELAQISAELGAGAVLNKPVHPENKQRLERAASRRKRTVRITAFDDNWFNLQTTDDPSAKGGGANV